MQKDIDMYREKFLMGWNEIRRLRTENRKELGFDVHEVNAFEPERFAPWNLSPEELITRSIRPIRDGPFPGVTYRKSKRSFRPPKWPYMPP